MAQSDQLLASDLYEPSTLFFDPDGEIMYFEVNGKLYEWKLRGRAREERVQSGGSVKGTTPKLAYHRATIRTSYLLISDHNPL